MSAVLDLPETPTTSLNTIKKAVSFALDEDVSVILSDVTWNTYQATIEEFLGKQNPHFFMTEGIY